MKSEMLSTLPSAAGQEKLSHLPKRAYPDFKPRGSLALLQSRVSPEFVGLFRF